VPGGTASSPAGAGSQANGSPADLAQAAFVPRPPGGVVTAGEPAGRSLDAQLAAIDRRAESEATARQALDEAEAMSGRLTTAAHRVYLGIIRAQAYGTLGQEDRACEALKGILPGAKGTSYGRKIGLMLESCP